MKKGVMIGIVIGVVILLGVVIFLLIGPKPNPEDREMGENLVKNASWQPKGVAISGQYADAEIVSLGTGNGYRMYYSEEPEVAGFSGKLYSATSSDGIIWSQESGVRKEWATFPSVMKLEDDRYRLYFQNDGKIKSAISSDGLTFSEESGVRMDSANSLGLVFENVAAPTVIKTGNDYVMVYRGTINERYTAEQVPNSNTQLFLWATSNDGLNFEKRGIAIDSRNSVFKGLLDGCEFVQWDNGVARLYFWSYSGVYHVVFNGSFSEEEFDFSTGTGSGQPFPENPPADPTLMKINDEWFMYYGQHGRGIYYANLE